MLVGGGNELVKALKPLLISGREVLAAGRGRQGRRGDQPRKLRRLGGGGGIGTVSAVNADSYDPEGKIIPQIYHGRTRRERHEELIDYRDRRRRRTRCSAPTTSPAARARSTSTCCGRWAARSASCTACSNGPQGLVAGVTCGAGMPYKLSEIAASYGVNYLPIVSSGRAFRALWKRAYSKAREWLAAVVYEDPWLAGGHNGLSNAEDPLQPQDPYPRVKELRETMREGGISTTRRS